MRRLILVDPFARSAIWSRNLAVFALVVAVVGVLLARKGLDPKAALAVEGSALVLAGFAILSALVAMAVTWHTGFRGIGLALGGLALSLLLFAYPAYLAVETRTVPTLTDVSTDLDDPPPFLMTQKALAARHGTTPPAKLSQSARDRQAALYPDLDSLSFDAEPLDVFRAIHKLVKHFHWQIVDEIEPVRFTVGHIDLVVKTAILGFPADVSFRIKTEGSQTRVDIRSVSRAGWQEQPGSNAARVQELAQDLDDLMSES